MRLGETYISGILVKQSLERTLLLYLVENDQALVARLDACSEH